jgi:hypothetical protein
MPRDMFGGETGGGGSGAVVLSKSDVGLSNANNTSDAGKPVSTAQQAALDLKQDVATAATDADLSALDVALSAELDTKDPYPTVVVAGNLGASRTVTFIGAEERWLDGTLNANLAVTVNTPVAGSRLILQGVQDATGGRTVTIAGQGVSVPSGANDPFLILVRWIDPTTFRAQSLGIENDEVALAEIAAHLADTSDAHDASAISVTGYTATNVQDALAEVAGGGGAAPTIDTLARFTALDYQPPASNPATYDTRNQHPVLDFDTTTQEATIFSEVLPRWYTGGGITVYLHWAATSAVTGTVGWDVAFERIADGGQDLDADGFATAKTVTATTVPGTSGVVKVTSVAFTDGAEIDSLVAGEAFRLRVRRDTATDTAAGDAELLRVELKET